MSQGWPRRPSPARCRAQAPSYHASDLVADVALTAYKHFSFNFDYLWNPYTSKTDKSEVSVQYRPDPTRVINIGYRFQENVLNETVILKQWDGSFAWPIAGHWNAVGRWVYSLQDKQTIEQLAGIEYKKLLLGASGDAAPLCPGYRRRRGTRHLDCITIGTDGPKFGRKTCEYPLGA